MLPYALYMTSGDREILSRQYSSMEDWIRAIPRTTNGLWDYKSTWKLADWLDPAAPTEDSGNATTDPNLVADAFLVHVTTLMCTTSSVLNKDKDHARYAETLERLPAAFGNEYVTPSGRPAGDTQTGLAMAINFSLLATEAQQQRAAESLAMLIRLNSRFRIATGFAGTPFLGHALTKAGPHCSTACYYTGRIRVGYIRSPWARQPSGRDETACFPTGTSILVI